MADIFEFKDYGTFTGPSDGNFTFDDSEPNWHEQLPTEGPSFNLTDIGVLFFQSASNYSYFHSTGNDVQNIILESSAGNLASLTCNVSQTFFNGDINANGNIVATGAIQALGSVNLSGVGDVASAINSNKALASSKKSFDISHPTKEGHRLRYICLEGPRADVYHRGKLKDSNVIEVPDYWSGLVDFESVDVSLTPIGCYQELFVEKIEWGKRIIVKNASGGPINCSFVVYAERKDTEKNIPEYIGLTPDDYPGDNGEYTINGIK